MVADRKFSVCFMGDCVPVDFIVWVLMVSIRLKVLYLGG